MFGLFNQDKFRGSTLEALLVERSKQLTNNLDDAFVNVSINAIAAALVAERPRFYEVFFGDSGKDIDIRIVGQAARTSKHAEGIDLTGQSDEELGSRVFAMGIASSIFVLILSANEAVGMYSSALDDLIERDKRTALVLSTIFIHCAEATELPLVKAEGGYHHHLRAYLLIRNALEMFGLLQPWQNLVDTKPPLMSVDLKIQFGRRNTDIFLRLMPETEKQFYESVMMELSLLKESLPLMPDFAAGMALQLALHNPQQLMTGRRERRPPPPDSTRCTFCNGTGRRSGCGGCNGRGTIIHLNEILPCSVCGGTGRARCDVCLGSGRRP